MNAAPAVWRTIHLVWMRVNTTIQSFQFQFIQNRMSHWISGPDGNIIFASHEKNKCTIFRRKVTQQLQVLEMETIIIRRWLDDKTQYTFLFYGRINFPNLLFIKLYLHVCVRASETFHHFSFNFTQCKRKIYLKIKSWILCSEPLKHEHGTVVKHWA